MYNKIASSALCLLRLASLASSLPVTVVESATANAIWVRKDNTLNATIYPAELKTINGVLLSLGSNDSTSNSIAPLSDSEGLGGDTSSNTASIPVTFPARTDRGPQFANLTTTALVTSTSSETSSSSSNDTYSVDAVASAASGTLQLQFINKWHTQNLIVTITGLDPNGALIMLGQNGQWVYPTTSSSTPQLVNANINIPLGKPNSTLSLTLPGYITSSRVWISEGPLKFYVVATPRGPGLVEPAAVNPADSNSQINYGFGELSWGQSFGLFADITAVDFVGLPLGLELIDTANQQQSVLGTPANAAAALCNQLKAQKKIDGRAWDQLCAYTPNGDLVRVLAPALLQSQKPKVFGTYFAEYVNDVWNHYKSHDLIIDTQTTPGNVTCRVTGNTLNCAGDTRGYAKPTNLDIFGCNTGSFAIQAGDNDVHLAVVPRLCAAFNRATLLLPDGNIQPCLPPQTYYTQDSARAVNTRPMNHYSDLVHKMEIGQKGYAFSYDDVAPSPAEDRSGLVFSTSPKMLTWIVGGSG
ncbi:glycoside hydrolase family 64 protein [Dothistroma septosporum NZE10]|uniref:Glycoside hydrolase family 64 protein n=1 Tax=Dothistroma septosporum (strain NZE10 / CBS 128990) TaxID=675120 RepID=N1PUC6_DOTSN|nr:glycoside hydrolase family 64 protein [Dothistroma septosporum NZE10]